MLEKIGWPDLVVVSPPVSRTDGVAQAAATATATVGRCELGNT